MRIAWAALNASVSCVNCSYAYVPLLTRVPTESISLDYYLYKFLLVCYNWSITHIQETSFI